MTRYNALEKFEIALVLNKDEVRSVKRKETTQIEQQILSFEGMSFNLITAHCHAKLVCCSWHCNGP
jgi:tmRNA-binding protein